MFLEAYKRALNVIVNRPVRLWGLSLLSGLIIVLGFLFTMPILALGVIVSYLVKCGMAKVYIDGLDGKEVNSDQIFAGFNKGFLRIAGGMAWTSLWVLIWCLVPIVGPIIGIVKMYSYRFVPYILITCPDIKATEAIRVSMNMTEGRKGQMFLADFCFGGAFVVVCLILGILGAIPFLGIIFRLVFFVVYIAYILFASIFSGLYQASFFVDAVRPGTAIPSEDMMY